MNDYELSIQKQLVSIFESLKKEIEYSRSQMTKLGYAQRAELYKHVTSNYNNHENLNKARNEWEQNGVRRKAMEWIYDLFVERRDLYGYFENYEEIKNEIDILIARSIEKEMFEISEYLNEWRKQFP